jgi:hypothetical protein
LKKWLLRDNKIIQLKQRPINNNYKLNFLKMRTKLTLIQLCLAMAIYFMPGINKTFAQDGVSINTSGTQADPSALLDVNGTAQGMLIPRVALVQTTSASPITTPANSLLVYNTVTVNDVTPGFYYWNTTESKWIRILGSGSGTNADDFIIEDTKTSPSGYSFTGDSVRVAGTDEWTSICSLPVIGITAGRAVFGDNGKLYYIGGYTIASTYVATTYEYNELTNTWTTKAPMPSPKSSFGIAKGNNGKIYCIGGQPTGQNTTNYEYDPATDSWTTKAPLPLGRMSAEAVCAGNGKIYVMGGFYNSAYVNTNYEYDPSTNTWATKAAMPTAKSGSGAAAGTNGKVYVFGGYDGTNYYNTTQEYDPTTNTWSSKTSMTEKKNDTRATTCNGKIYLVGGYDGTSYFNTTNIYDVSTNSWLYGKPIPYMGTNFGIAYGNGTIYIAGGTYYGATYYNAVEAYKEGKYYYIHRKN